MPIANRDLKPGTTLVADYKGEHYSAELVKTKDGPRYQLPDGRQFKSPSAAGAAVKGDGKTCDGWEFWSVEGAEPVPVRAKRQQGATAATGAPTEAKKPPTKPVAARKAKSAPKAKKARKTAGKKRSAKKGR